MSSAATRRPKTMRLHVLIEGAGKTAAGFEVPPAVVQQLGSGKRPAVQVTIGKHTYPSTVATMNGGSYNASFVTGRPRAAASSARAAPEE